MKGTGKEDSLSYWRFSIIRMLYVFAFLILITEIFALLAIFVWGWLQPDHTLTQSLFFYLIMPTLLNFSIVTACHVLQKRPGLSEQAKNNVLVLGTSLLVLMIVLVHDVLPATLASFALPVIMTVLFADRVLTHRAGWLNVLFLLMVLLKAFIFKDDDTRVLVFYLNAASAALILLAAWLLSIVLMTYIQDRQNSLANSYDNQKLLKEQLKYDSLTGLYNQKALQTLMHEAIHRTGSDQQPFSIAMIDLDDFKKVNDRMGHAAGDRLLALFGAFLCRNSRQGADITGRYGGDEFVIILQSCPAAMALKKIEVLKAAWLTEWYKEFNSDHLVTFSCGIAEFEPTVANAGQLFNQADQALYEAKRSGKNKVLLSAGPAQPIGGSDHDL